MTFNLRDTVTSQPCGSKESFVGVVIAKDSTGYTIRDAFNLRWLRDESDLTLVKSGSNGVL